MEEFFNALIALIKKIFKMISGWIEPEDKEPEAE